MHGPPIGSLCRARIESGPLVGPGRFQRIGGDQCGKGMGDTSTLRPFPLAYGCPLNDEGVGRVCGRLGIDAPADPEFTSQHLQKREMEVIGCKRLQAVERRLSTQGGSKTSLTGSGTSPAARNPAPLPHRRDVRGRHHRVRGGRLFCKWAPWLYKIVT